MDTSRKGSRGVRVKCTGIYFFFSQGEAYFYTKWNEITIIKLNKMLKMKENIDISRFLMADEIWWKSR